MFDTVLGLNGSLAAKICLRAHMYVCVSVCVRNTSYLQTPFFLQQLAIFLCKCVCVSAFVSVPKCFQIMFTKMLTQLMTLLMSPKNICYFLLLSASCCSCCGSIPLNSLKLFFLFFCWALCCLSRTWSCFDVKCTSLTENNKNQKSS